MRRVTFFLTPIIRKKINIRGIQGSDRRGGWRKHQMSLKEEWPSIATHPAAYALAPLCLPARARPLPLQRRAPLHNFSLAGIHPQSSRLHIRPQARRLRTRFRIFPLCLPPHTRPLPLQRRPPLRIFSLAGIHPQSSHLPIRRRVRRVRTRLCIFPPLRPGARLSPFPLPD